MSSINALRNSLDRAHQNAKSGLEDALREVVETGSIEDFEAYIDASHRVQLTGSVVGEELRAQHGLTRAIIDGIQ